MPVILSADSVCLVQMMGGELVLERKNYTIDYDIRKVCPTGSSPLPSPGVSGRYEMTAAMITFRDSTGVKTGSGDVRGDTLIVPGRVQTLRFVRD